jgi:hypothetical protein
LIPQYEARFEVGSTVRIVGAQALADFRRDWLYHNKLQDDQVGHAGEAATVINVGYYHGGDPLYWLYKVPGVWHEQCLEPVPGREDIEPLIDFLNRQQKADQGTQLPTDTT